jgi:hypothetical protein
MIPSNNLNENTCVTKMDMIPSEAGGSLEPPWIWCMLAICVTPRFSKPKKGHYYYFFLNTRQSARKIFTRAGVIHTTELKHIIVRPTR